MDAHFICNSISGGIRQRFGTDESMLRGGDGGNTSHTGGGSDATWNDNIQQLPIDVCVPTDV